ncbi:hypothetical protein L211DRAFT_892042 [Terfezia boudieri ATCC MYA-4762]|uniref:Uncharacterized protein n=1 Tax=Terfezia boudieri ATCC MYA-4762 TaxID=1051890 RepID=A0A3N4LDC0_9PEZI|nr:hypothetical protein L211DRAFT_892042 [Terfezia boudieri ATCC MYA-4762]
MHLTPGSGQHTPGTASQSQPEGDYPSQAGRPSRGVHASPTSMAHSSDPSSLLPSTSQEQERGQQAVPHDHVRPILPSGANPVYPMLGSGRVNDNITHGHPKYVDAATRTGVSEGAGGFRQQEQSPDGHYSQEPEQARGLQTYDRRSHHSVLPPPKANLGNNMPGHYGPQVNDSVTSAAAHPTHLDRSARATERARKPGRQEQSDSDGKGRYSTEPFRDSGIPATLSGTSSNNYQPAASGGLHIFGIQVIGGGNSTDESSVTKLKKELQQAHRENKKLLAEQEKERHKVSRLQTEIQSAARQNEAARHQATLAQDRYRQLRRAYEQQVDENRIQQHRIEKFAAQVDNKELFLGNQQSDSEILGMFRSLFTHVKSWSLAFSSEHQVEKSELRERPDFESVMSQIAPGDTNFQLLDKRSTRRLCVQGIVGYTLAEAIFRRVTDLEVPGSPPALDQWSQGSADAIDKIEQNLFRGQPEITPRELNDWRAFTVALISRIEARTTGSQQERAVSKQEKHSASILEMISAWAKPTEDPKNIEAYLKGIIQEAIEMALVLRKQRACWSVKFPPPPAIFDAKIMEDIDGDDEGYEHEEGMVINRRVALFIFPGLYKRGNADGEHYDIESCLIKTKVQTLDHE